MVKNRGGRKRQRQINYRKPKFPRLLIVTEGTDTEVHYFQGIKNNIQRRFQDQIILKKVDIDLRGTGRGTTQVVYEARKQRNRNMYSEVWVMFDKDDFSDFDYAIQLAENEGMEVAWSNRCFELWILLHFEQVTTPLSTSQYTSKLNQIFARRKLGDGSYKKTDSELFDKLEPFVREAVNRSERLLGNEKGSEHFLPSKVDPATTVHQLVSKLLPYLEE